LPTSTCHVRKVSVGLKRTYRISAGDGTGRRGELLGTPRTAQSRRRIRPVPRRAVHAACRDRPRRRDRHHAAVRAGGRGWGPGGTR